MNAAKTPKRGPKAKPAKPRMNATPTREKCEPSFTKKGPGRRHDFSKSSGGPRVASPTKSAMKAVANIGREPRRVWRDGEPVHIVKPARAARLARARLAEAA